MSTTTILGLAALGGAAGYMSGLVGIGGGTIIVPILVVLFGYSQQTAQGTTLALLLPPIGLFAVYTYYEKGFVDFKTAGLLCAGFLIGSYFGGRTAVQLPQETLRRIFAVVLILLGARMLFSSK